MVIYVLLLHLHILLLLVTERSNSRSLSVSMDFMNDNDVFKKVNTEVTFCSKTDNIDSIQNDAILQCLGEALDINSDVLIDKDNVNSNMLGNRSINDSATLNYTITTPIYEANNLVVDDSTVNKITYNTVCSTVQHVTYASAKHDSVINLVVGDGIVNKVISNTVIFDVQYDAFESTVHDSVNSLIVLDFSASDATFYKSLDFVDKFGFSNEGLDLQDTNLSVSVDNIELYNIGCINSSL